MMRTLALPALLISVAILPAQTIDILGNTSYQAIGGPRAKGNLFGVTSSLLVLEFEVRLDMSGPDTLEFFAYRHHSRSGISTLDWSLQVPVAGSGLGWYSTGPIVLPLIEGNHYILGAAWTNSATYYFSVIPNAPTPVSFGTWERAHTINPQFPLPPTVGIPLGVDAAQYYQRITSVPFGAVTNVGTGCGGARLVAGGAFNINSTTDLEIVGGAPASLGVFSFALGSTLPVAAPLFGCDVWLDLNGPVFSNAIITDGAGYAVRPFTVPNNPAFSGTSLAVQAGVLSGGIDITNAIDLQIN